VILDQANPSHSLVLGQASVASVEDEVIGVAMIAVDGATLVPVIHFVALWEHEQTCRVVSPELVAISVAHGQTRLEIEGSGS